MQPLDSDLMRSFLAVADLGSLTAAAGRLFGQAGIYVVTTMILLAMLGSINGTVMTGSRIAYAMAKDGLLFKQVAKVHGPSGAPRVAIAVQAAVALAVVFGLRGFLKALDYTTFAIVLATIADTLALYMLRVRRPTHPRPYRAWGYPVVPFFYVVASLGITASMLREKPRECGIGLAILLAGLPFYALFRRTRR